MSSIMDLNAFTNPGLGEASSRVRARVLKSSRLSSFFNPNIVPPKSQSRPFIALLQRPRVIRATTKDDIGETKLSDLRALLTPQSPCYIDYGLIYYSVLVACCEISWILKNFPKIPGESKEDARSWLRGIVDEFSTRDALEVKRMEEMTGISRVKAVQYFLDRRCRSNRLIAMVFKEFPIFPLPPAGVINHLAQALMFAEAIKSIEFHVLDDLIEAICHLMAKLNHVSNTRITSYSKGLMGIPKPIPNSKAELKVELHKIFQVERTLLVKLKLADVVTNYMNQDNDDIYLASNDWPRIAERFLVSLGMSTAHGPDQFEIRDHMLILSEAFTGFNKVLMGVTEGLTIAPLIFIDDCGIIGENLLYANKSFRYLIDKLPDTSIDSSVLRNMNIGLEHSLIAYKNTLRGIAKLCRKIDEDKQEVLPKSAIESPRHKYSRGFRDKAEETTPHQKMNNATSKE